MKKEDIYNGVTEIRDDIIEKAEKKSNKRIWQGAVAAVLALSIAVAGVAVWRRDPSADIPDGDAAPSGNTDKVQTGVSIPGDPDDPTTAEPAPGGPGAGIGIGDAPGAPGGGTGDAPVSLLAEVTYPDRVKYPATSDGSYIGTGYDEWLRDKLDRALTEAERERFHDYIAAVMPELLRSNEGENAVSSPMNVYMALSLLAESTGGKTREQVMELLGVDSIEELRTLAKRTWEALYNDDGTYSLSLANSLWLRDDWDYSEEAVKSLADNYYAWSFRGEMGSEEYNNTLRTWLNGNTGGLLEDQIGGIGLDGDTALCLASAMYFGDKWDVKFDPEDTKTGLFHSPEGDVEAEFMRRTLKSDGVYYWGDNFGAVIIPFEQGGAMLLLLPDEGVTMEEIFWDEAAMSFLAGDIDAAERQGIIINLSLPKFDVERQTDLVGALERLGVTDAFTPGTADFSPLAPGAGESGDIWVSNVLHGARVTVDEEGCVAAAYTVMPVNGAEPPPEEQMDLTFDRPFLFSVISSGLPIFTGTVMNP